MSSVGDVASILGLILAVVTLWRVLGLQKRFLARASMPRLQGEILKLADELAGTRGDQPIKVKIAALGQKIHALDRIAVDQVRKETKSALALIGTEVPGDLRAHRDAVYVRVTAVCEAAQQYLRRIEWSDG